MATPIAHPSVRRRRFRLAETDASDHASAACYRRSKHIGIEAVVVPELKFRDVQRHVFGTDFDRNGFGDERDDGIAGHLLSTRAMRSPLRCTAPITRDP